MEIPGSGGSTVKPPGIENPGRVGVHTGKHPPWGGMDIFWIHTIDREDTSPSLRFVGFPRLQIFVKMFHRNLQSPVWKCMLVHVCGALIWRPETSVNIWNLLWLSSRLVICTEQTNIYTSTFPKD